MAYTVCRLIKREIQFFENFSPVTPSICKYFWVLCKDSPAYWIISYLRFAVLQTRSSFLCNSDSNSAFKVVEKIFENNFLIWFLSVSSIWGWFLVENWKIFFLIFKFKKRKCYPVPHFGYMFSEINFFTKSYSPGESLPKKVTFSLGKKGITIVTWHSLNFDNRS